MEVGEEGGGWGGGWKKWIPCEWKEENEWMMS